jgi:Tol biopolymer transport system component
MIRGARGTSSGSSKSLKKTFCLALFYLLAAPVWAAEEGDRFISGARQLTFEGRRAGEGYFSPDGTRLVFQSEREPGNPFYQIYELDLTTGDGRRVSPGSGKTTCAFFSLGGDILFSSTHHDPRTEELQKEELEFRASGRERRYAWDYDPEMDLYAADAKGKLRRLTDERGYDAEGSYSPDGRWIVFASNRQAYERELSEDERKQLDVDPAFFAELYIMPADGGPARRLTSADGYDGGPFFTPDGERVVWRRFDGAGLIADIWTMKTDGTDARQLTDFKSMSWAPYPHPSGEYFIFTTNKHGFENFELFIVDAAGSKDPVRVTFIDGFDGLPVFAPNGERIAWTVKRGSGDGGQLWLGRWDHAAALAAIEQAPARAKGKP